MQSIIVVIALFFSFIVAVFALQNSDPIAIKFILWKFHQVPLVIIMLGSALFGAFITFVFSLRKSVGTRLKIHDLNKRLGELEKRNKIADNVSGAEEPHSTAKIITPHAETDKEGGTDQK